MICLHYLSSDTTINELVILIVRSLAVAMPFICILVPCGKIIASVLRTPSTKGICKAFSTCGSHLSVVCLNYGATIGLYLAPSSSNTNNKNVIVTLLYILVTTMLNLVIYSLRNQNIKGALRNVLIRRMYSQWWMWSSFFLYLRPSQTYTWLLWLSEF